MKKKELRNKLYSLYDAQVPDDFSSILSKAKEKGRMKNMKEQTKKTGWFWKLGVAFTFLLVIGIGFYSLDRQYFVDSIIELDVNPSIELQVNKKDKIRKAVALNEDAKEILQDMDFEGVDIDIALNAIIGSMVTKGYLNDLANSILISVDNRDTEKAEILRKQIVEKIDSILSGDKIDSSVLSQTIKKQATEAEELASNYNISLGKAEFILDVVKNNPLLKAENLVNLSINEINVLTQNKTDRLSTVEKQGNASTKAYIGEDKARDIALSHAKVTKPNALEIEFDTENGVILYEVEFKDTTYEYEYEIDAKTGEIITSKKEKEDDKEISNNTSETNTNTNTNRNFIGEDKARDIALSHAKVSNPQNLKIELDREDQEYSVEFYYDGYEYDYEINAVSGAILSSDKEKD